MLPNGDKANTSQKNLPEGRPEVAPKEAHALAARLGKCLRLARHAGGRPIPQWGPPFGDEGTGRRDAYCQGRCERPRALISVNASG
jgi:hypothetical protein